MEKQDPAHPFSFALICEVNSIRNGLSTYVNLSHEIEQMLDHKEKQIAGELRETLRSTHASEHQDIHESYALNFRPYETIFPFLHREAMFLTLYNYFEHSLSKLCDSIGEEIQSRVRIKDVQGKGVERALLFLTLVPEFQFTRIPAVMDVIRGANQLRNNIVHAGGVLPDQPSHRLNIFVAAHPQLGGSAGSSVSLQAKFVSAFSSALTEFFDEFERQTQRYMDRTWRKYPEKKI